jgi:branched-chain amino acid transport system ATP-binding protein
VAAVRGISFEVHQGEIVTLIGPNGAGKSTTLMAIAGAIVPSGGTVELAGRSIVGAKPETIVRRGVALVPEGRRIFSTLTVRENLSIGGATRRDRTAFEHDLASALDRFPILKTYLDAPAGRLSGGEQQQLAIARALLSAPSLLLLDEPSLGLAPQVVDIVFDALDGLRQAGVTICLVEQDALGALELADRAYVMRTGEIELSGTAEEILNDPRVEATYLGVSTLL